MKTVHEVLGGRTTHWVAATWPIRRVVEYLCEKHVGAVPVVDGEEIVGVFSERDLMHRVVVPGLDLDQVAVREVMTVDVIHVDPDETFQSAKALMLQRKVRHLVVKDHNGRLKGFISLRQLSETALEEANSLISKLNDDYYESPGGA